jgi:hypothetical protein
MKKSKTQKVKAAFDEIFASLSPEEKQREQEVLLSNRFLSEIEKALKAGRNGITNKKLLSKKVGTSASYMTQLFQNDKIINISMIVKIVKALDLKLEVKMVPKNEQTWEPAAKMSYLRSKSFKTEPWPTEGIAPTDEDYERPNMYLSVHYNEDKVA